MKLSIFLLIASMLDAVFTHLGIASGFIGEGNPVSKFLIQENWIYFYTVKILLPLILMGICYIYPLKGNSRLLLVSACILYSSVLVIHLAWIILFV